MPATARVLVFASTTMLVVALLGLTLDDPYMGVGAIFVLSVVFLAVALGWRKQ